MPFLLHGPSPYRTEIRVRDIDNLGSHHRRTMFSIKRLAFRRLPIGEIFFSESCFEGTEGIASIGRRRCLLLFFSPSSPASSPNFILVAASPPPNSPTLSSSVEIGRTERRRRRRRTEIGFWVQQAIEKGKKMPRINR